MSFRNKWKKDVHVVEICLRIGQVNVAVKHA